MALAGVSRHGVGQVLAEGGGLFVRRFAGVFPWILAAELLQVLPFAASGNLFTMDLGLLAQPGYLARALAFGLIQTWLYSVAVLRLAGEPLSPRLGWRALRAVPAVLIAYLLYELAVGLGLVFSFIVFMIGLFIAGALFGLVLCLLPLAPTAAVSTALALFLFPAVLEKRGPFAALGESSRLAKTRWVRVSLVVSAPALALLAAWCVQNGPEVAHVVHAYLSLLQQSSEQGLGLDDVQRLQASLGQSGGGMGAWQVVGAVLGALAWWYTLAVCYAQYRDLKREETSA